MDNQLTSTILMIRPAQFRLNEQTSGNNYYQQALENFDKEEIKTIARKEFDDFVEVLRNNGIHVIVIEDTEIPDTPDALFPNNWISFHSGGIVVLYPMNAPNRRLERREDILTQLKENYSLSDVIDLTYFEEQGIFLEGTGSMVLDRKNKIVYAALSERTHLEALEEFCQKLDYIAETFVAYQTVENMRLPIYHTNVMMCLGDDFAVICLASIDDLEERKSVTSRLQSTGKEIVEISEEQKHHFAGNMLQLLAADGNKKLVMSKAAFDSLSLSQVRQLEEYCAIIVSPIPVIERLGGGSARCMMAEVFLSRKV